MPCDLFWNCCAHIVVSLFLMLAISISLTQLEIENSKNVENNLFILVQFYDAAMYYFNGSSNY